MAKVDRDKEQEKAGDLWLASNRYASLILGTGFGKSRVTLLILDTLFKNNDLNKDSKILLLSNSERLRDVSWKDEFDKWNMSWAWDMVTSECYQTTYKWKGEKWDFVVADEIDFAMTDEYKHTFLNNEFGMVLGITGFVDPNKEDLLKSIAPVLMTYSTQDAQKDGILNKTQIVFVEYELSTNPKDITVEYTRGKDKKSFPQSENDAYSYAEDTFNITWGKIDKLKQDPEVTMGLDSSKIAELQKLEYKLKLYISKRKNILYKGIASKNVTKELIQRLLKNEKGKVITFSMLTDQADAINEFTFHGKNKVKNFDFLRQLNASEIRSLGVCKAIDRGENVEGVNNLIMESYNSSATQFAQRHGRGMRLLPNQTMYLYVLLPFYKKKVKSPENHGGLTHVRRSTQAVKWAKEMMSTFSLTGAITIRKGKNVDEWYRIT